MEGEDKSVLFGFHRFDPEINCQGLNDTYSINHRLNVIMRAGQVVKRGLQVLVTASYLKVWSQETKCQLKGFLAYVQHQPISSSKDPNSSSLLEGLGGLHKGGKWVGC